MTPEAIFSKYWGFFGISNVGINMKFILCRSCLLCKPWARRVRGAVIWCASLEPACLERYKRMVGNHLQHSCTQHGGRGKENVPWGAAGISSELRCSAAVSCLVPSVKLSRCGSRLNPMCLVHLIVILTLYQPLWREQFSYEVFYIFKKLFSMESN